MERCYGNIRVYKSSGDGMDYFGRGLTPKGAIFFSEAIGNYLIFDYDWEIADGAEIERKHMAGELVTDRPGDMLTPTLDPFKDCKTLEDMRKVVFNE